MDIRVEWDQPETLRDGAKVGLIYTILGLDEWEPFPGVYMFCRKHGENLIPLYIGRSKNVPARLSQHLNTTKMMLALQNSKNGSKVVVVGEIAPRPGQDLEKVLQIAESSLIEHALSEGHELINKVGTKTPVHKITFTGCRDAKGFSGSTMYAKMR